MDLEIAALFEADLDPFLPLLGEIECGRHFAASEPGHRAWLRRKLAAQIATGVRFFGCRGGSGEALGIVGVSIEERIFCAPRVEVTDIGVAQFCRRRGLGSRLLEHAVLLARESGAGVVFVRTYAADTGVIAFYGRNAFYPVAVIPGTNGPQDEGDLVMRKTLG